MNAMEIVQETLGPVEVIEDQGEAPDTESPYSYTVKTPKGNLLSIRGRSTADLAYRLSAVAAPATVTGQSILDLVREIETAISGAPPQQQYGQQGGYQQQPQQQYGAQAQSQYGQQYGGQPPQQQGSLAPSCAHGPMKYIATGRFGPFYACPTPQGAPDKCKSVNAR